MKTSRRRVVLALGSTVLVPLFGADAAAQTPSRADRTFETLGRRWLDRSMRYSPVSATTIGDHRYDNDIDDVSAAGRNAALFCGSGYPGSGISLADASYFGRRAGRAAARASSRG